MAMLRRRIEQRLKKKQVSQPTPISAPDEDGNLDVADSGRSTPEPIVSRRRTTPSQITLPGWTDVLR
jgi:hypothetical protein